MPLLHECKKAGCKKLIEISEKYCKQHKNFYARQYDRLRMTNKATRDYRLFYQSKAWKDLRRDKLQSDPLCERCLLKNKYTIATDVHHIKDVFNHWSLRLNYDNLQALCKSCHEGIHKLGYYPPVK